MITRYQRITIIKSRKPLKKDINEELQWFGTSLGLFNLRDKDKSCFRIFIELLKSAKKGSVMSSDEIAAKLGLSRGSVIHHINRLIETGIVVPEKKGYILRVSKLEELINEIRKDLDRTIIDLKDIANDIDKWLAL